MTEGGRYEPHWIGFDLLVEMTPLGLAEQNRQSAEVSTTISVAQHVRETFPTARHT